MKPAEVILVVDRKPLQEISLRSQRKIRPIYRPLPAAAQNERPVGIKTTQGASLFNMAVMYH